MADLTDPSKEANVRVDASLGERRPPLQATISRLEDLVALRRRWEQSEAQPVLAADRSAGLDQSWGGMDIRTLLCGEQSAGRSSVHSIVLANGCGFPAHFHLDAHTFIFVARGDVELRVGDEVESVGTFGFAYAPPNTRQSFQNRSDREAELVVYYTPAGAERAFGHAREHWLGAGQKGPFPYAEILQPYGFCFDGRTLDNDARTNEPVRRCEIEISNPGDLEKLRGEFARQPPAPRLLSTSPEEYEVTADRPRRAKALLIGDESAGVAMLNLVSGAPGFGAASHYQPTEDEYFFIAGGSLQLTCGTVTSVLKPGAFAYCPRNCSHAFRNASASDSVQFLTFNSPAGHERAMAGVRRSRERGATNAQLHALAAVGGYVFHSVNDLGGEPT